MCIGPETAHSIAVVSEGKTRTLLKQAKEYRLNHSAAEFVSSESSGSSTISEHTEEDEDHPYTSTDAVPEHGMVDQGIGLGHSLLEEFFLCCSHLQRRKHFRCVL